MLASSPRNRGGVMFKADFTDRQAGRHADSYRERERERERDVLGQTLLVL